MSTISDDQFADLAERTQQLRDLTETYGWLLYKDRCEKEIELRHREVLRGELTPEQYHRTTGWIAGADAMLKIPAIAQQQLNTILEQRREAQPEDEEEQEAA